jgi:hypothetical protein
VGHADRRRATEKEPRGGRGAARTSVSCIRLYPACAHSNRPHTFSADELYAAHIGSFLQQTNKELEEKIKTTQVNNQDMMQSILSQRAEMEELTRGLEGVIEDLEGSVQAMTGADESETDWIKKDVWSMEQEVAATR